MKDREEKKYSRSDFLKYSFAAIAGFATLGFLGCQGDTSAKPNVPLPKSYNFIGDPNGRIYHKPSCKYAKIKNTTVFFDSPTAAHHSGFRPCRICKPNEI